MATIDEDIYESTHTGEELDASVDKVNGEGAKANQVLTKLSTGETDWADPQGLTSVAWDDVTGKPETFTPSAHTHTKSEIIDFPASMPASDVYPWAKQSTKPSYTTTEVSEGTNLYFTESRAKAVKVDNATKADSATTAGSCTGNAATATKFASAQSIALTGDVTGSASSQADWSIATTIGAGKVTNNMLAGGIANSKLAYSSMMLWGARISLGGTRSGNMTSVGNISFSATGKNIGGIAYFDTTNNYLGIGTSSPSAKLHVAGDILATGGVTAYSTSDRRLKENIEDVDCLEEIETLGGIKQFDFKKDGKHSVGLIAQEVQKSAYKDAVFEREDKTLAINYLDPRFISLALGGVEQLSKKCEHLEQENAELKARLAKLESMVEQLINK